MKVAILQLSDIHLRVGHNLVIDYKDAFCRSCKEVINECSKLIIVITGDIVNTGKNEEYDEFIKFFNDCIKFWKSEATFLNSVEYVVVPGNHDCKFDKKEQNEDEESLRDLVIRTILSKDKLSNEEYKMRCLEVQKDFWTFYEKLTGKKQYPVISWNIEIKLTQEFSFYFDCYNTAFLSKINENQGCLMIPENSFINRSNKKNGIVFSLFHHNTGWITTKTPNDNRKRFESHIFETSDIVMCGHEHSTDSKIISGLNDKREIVYLESAAFQSGDQSKFSTLLFEIENNIIKNNIVEKTDYSFNGEKYEELNTSTIEIKKKKQGICLTDTWLKDIDEIDIPLKHERKQNLKLSDVYIYPDLESEKNTNPYFDSKDLVNSKLKERIYLIEGDDQCGKTSLLKMLFYEYYSNGIYPLFITGKDISHPNIKDVLTRQCKKQYDDKTLDYKSGYKQLERKLKVLLIDNLDCSMLNPTNKVKMLQDALISFEKIIITNNQRLDIKNSLLAFDNEDEVARYRILPLGYVKRNDLIEKWVRLGKDSLTMDESAFLMEVRNTFDQISNLLGQQLIPAYPVFILSLLQGLNTVLSPFDLSKTSYAYCYTTLLFASLIKIGVEEKKVNGIINFICEFSFFLYENKKTSNTFTKDLYNDFFVKYSEEYNTSFNADKLFELLCHANIFKLSDEESITFSYKYIYYFLVAKKISSLEDKRVECIVKNLCENLHKEREANILIFLVYHNGMKNQMDELLYTSMLPFENTKEITLNNDDRIIKELLTFVESIKTTILLNNVDPTEERKQNLQKADNRERTSKNSSHITEKELEENANLKDFNNSIKIIKILGQIIKNQPETIKKDDLKKLIKESYSVCFRTVAFFSKMVEESKQDIIDCILEQNKIYKKYDNEVLKSKVQKFLQILMYKQCISMFNVLTLSIGSSGMKKIFDDVTASFDTPAAKIVTFFINTYYGHLRIEQLKNIIEEFHDNPVATEIIKSRVLNYVYNNKIELKERQQIGDLCSLKLVDKSERLTLGPKKK